MRHARLRLWPPLSPAVHAQRPARRLPFPLGEPSTALFARGRHALWHGLRGLGVQAGDELLVPAYHCGSEIEAAVAAGLTCRFYEATETLSPDASELEALVGPRTRGLLLIHYFGFPQEAARWRTWCDERGLFLVEDCAHAWLATLDGRPLGSFGDVAAFSLYKTLPLPDGGALVSASPPPTADSGGWGVTAAAKRHVRWLMARSAGADELISRHESPHEDDFALGAPDRGPSATTRYLLRRLAGDDVAARRRAHYRLLLERLADRVPAAFATLPAGACPLIFPLAASDTAALVAGLEREGVAARPFWPTFHPLLPRAEFPRAVAWHERFVALPVHQELRAPDVERLVLAVQRQPPSLTRHRGAP